MQALRVLVCIALVCTFVWHILELELGYSRRCMFKHLDQQAYLISHVEVSPFLCTLSWSQAWLAAEVLML
jgi:hypothetical protein